MNLFVEDKYNAVQFEIKADNMVLSSQNIDLGNAKDELEIEYGGDDLNLGFNGRYFMEAMQVMHSEKVKAYIGSVESPCLIEGDEDELIALLKGLKNKTEPNLKAREFWCNHLNNYDWNRNKQ